MTISPWAFALLLLVVAGIGLVAGYALAVFRSAVTRSSGHEDLGAARTDAAAWRARAEELERRAELAEERAERDGSVLRALAPVRTQLEQVGTRVEAMERERAQQHATLSEQLRTAATTEQELRRATLSLEGALRSRTARGVWGEVELARVLEASGMMRHVDFSEQRSVGSVLRQRTTARTPGSSDATEPGAGATTGPGGASRSRPDVVVHLPGHSYLALDAKVPLDSYLTAVGVEERDEASRTHREQLLTAHARALRAHVDALAQRHYDRALENSPELVVLFVPAEPILASALEADPGLLEHALDLGVALTSPASLLALLRTCATAWVRTAVNDDARELLALGRTLYDRLGTVASHLDSLGTALRRSVQAYNRAVGSMETRLLVTARSLENLGAQLPEVSAIEADAGQVRSFSAPELTATPVTSARQPGEPGGESSAPDGQVL